MIFEGQKDAVRTPLGKRTEGRWRIGASWQQQSWNFRRSAKCTLGIPRKATCSRMFLWCALAVTGMDEIRQITPRHEKRPRNPTFYRMRFGALMTTSAAITVHVLHRHPHHHPHRNIIIIIAAIIVHHRPSSSIIIVIIIIITITIIIIIAIVTIMITILTTVTTVTMLLSTQLSRGRCRERMDVGHFLKFFSITGPPQDSVIVKYPALFCLLYVDPLQAPQSWSLFHKKSAQALCSSLCIARIVDTFADAALRKSLSNDKLCRVFAFRQPIWFSFRFGGPDFSCQLAMGWWWLAIAFCILIKTKANVAESWNSSSAQKEGFLKTRDFKTASHVDSQNWRAPCNQTSMVVSRKRKRSAVPKRPEVLWCSVAWSSLAPHVTLGILPRLEC